MAKIKPFPEKSGKNSRASGIGAKKNTLEAWTWKKWLPDQDSNLDKLNQNQLCYRYTIGQNKVNIHRILLKSSPKLKKSPKKDGFFRITLDFHSVMK